MMDEEKSIGFVGSGFGWHRKGQLDQHSLKGNGSLCARRRRLPTMVISRGSSRSSRTMGEDGGDASSPSSIRLGKGMSLAEKRRKVRDWFGIARQTERKGDFVTAEDLLEKCVQLDERDSHSWLALARIRSRRDTHAARKTFRDAMKIFPENVHLLQALGVLEHRCGNLEDARELFKKGLSLEPDNPYVCQAWGLLEQRNGQTDVARRLYEQCVERRPQSEVCAAWATLELGDGNADKARELFALGFDCVHGGAQKKVTILTAWAEAEERLGDFPRARELLTRALDEISSPETRMALAKLEARNGSLQRALELMRRMEANPQRLPASVYNGWACLEMQANNIKSARSLLQEGHTRFPLDAALLQTWGTLEERVSAHDRARELYGKSVEVRPTAVALVAWGCLEARLGEVTRARELFEEALRTDPLHGAAYNAFANLEVKQGNFQRACEIFELGLDNDPSPSVILGYAQLEMKFGSSRTDKARELLRRGVSQTRGDSSFIWHAWLTLELRARDPRAARQIAEQARKRYPSNSRVSRGAKHP